MEFGLKQVERQNDGESVALPLLGRTGERRLTEHLEDGFARLGDTCRRHAGDSAHGRGTCRPRRRRRRRRCLGDRRLLVLVTAGGNGRATQRDAYTNVENCNENHRQNEEQEC